MIDDLFTEESIKKLIAWAESVDMPKEPFRLSKWEYIEDHQLFLTVNKNLAKNNYREKLQVAKPAILRLDRLREYMEKDNGPIN